MKKNSEHLFKQLKKLEWEANSNIYIHRPSLFNTRDKKVEEKVLSQLKVLLGGKNAIWYQEKDRDRLSELLSGILSPAAYYKKTQIVDFLLSYMNKNKIDIAKTKLINCLYHATMCGYLAMQRFALDLIIKNKLTIERSYIHDSLVWAAKKGHLNTFKVFLAFLEKNSRTIKKNVRARALWWSLEGSIETGKFDVARYILFQTQEKSLSLCYDSYRYGGSEDEALSDCLGKALQGAAWEGNLEGVKFVINTIDQNFYCKKAIEIAPGCFGWALRNAIGKLHLKTVEWLVKYIRKYGPDIDRDYIRRGIGEIMEKKRRWEDILLEDAPDQDIRQRCIDAIERCDTTIEGIKKLDIWYWY